MPDESIHARQGQPSHGRAVLLSPWPPSVRCVLLAVLALCLLGCSAPGVRYADGVREGPMVILGDSLGAGYGVEKGEGFVPLLEQRLGTTIVNLCVSGATTEQSLPRVKEEVLPLKPGLVLLQLGGNDALQKVDVAATRKNLAAMIEQIQADGIPVLLIGVRGGLLSDDYADMYSGLSKEYETGLVPNLLDGILTHPELKLDSIHPNATGHIRLADLVEPELRRIWKVIGGSH